MSETIKLAAFCGSLRKASFNRLALAAFTERLPAGTTLSTIEFGDWPHYDTDGAMVVTNAGFTAQAITLARSADVQLWDRHDIARELIDPRRGTPRNP